VELIASEAWDGFQIAGEMVEKVERVLDVRQGKLCWVAGTIYMEMPLKPNILEDIGKDVSVLLFVCLQKEVESAGEGC
jgi:DNA polymerase delta subunit 2